MALKVKIHSENGLHSIAIDDRLLELLDWKAEQEILLQVQGNQLLLKPEGAQALAPDQPRTPPPLPPLPAQEMDLEHYWNLARDRQEREKFMNTVRPYLKVKLGYDYSEVVCEEKAKILCRKYYLAQERGEQFTTPFWAAIEN